MKKHLFLVLGVFLLVFIAVLVVLILPDGKSADDRLKVGIINNDKDGVKKALNDGADPNIEINDYPALVQAIRQLNSRNRDISIAQALVNAGADYSDSRVIITALQLCATESYLLDLETDFIPYIISLGADVDTKIDGVNDVFAFAVKHNLNFRILYAAVAAGCNVNVHIDGGDDLPLEYVIKTARHTEVSTLVRLGSEIPQSIEGVDVKTYVLSRYGESIAKSFYSDIFTV